jgi:predicted Fe-S protein YdhL (DUF1289 family)
MHSGVCGLFHFCLPAFLPLTVQNWPAQRFPAAQNLLILAHYQLIVTPMIDQGELFDIPSPCRRICELNNRGYCKGCFRSRDERLYWNQFTTFQKQLVVNLCEKRRLKVLSAKQQSAASNEEETAIPQLDMFTVQNEHVSSAPTETENSSQTDNRSGSEHTASQDTPDSSSATAIIGEPAADPLPEHGHQQSASLFEAESAVTEIPDNTQNMTTSESGDNKDKDKEEKTEKTTRARSQTRTRKADDSQLDMFS